MQPPKPVAGTLKIPGFLRRTEFIEGTGNTLVAPLKERLQVATPKKGGETMKSTVKSGLGSHSQMRNAAAKAVRPALRDPACHQHGSGGREQNENTAISARHGLPRGAGADELAHQ